MNPEELYNFNKTRTIMGVYQDVGKGVIKPGKSEKILAERLAEVNKTIPQGPGVGFEDTTGVYSKPGQEAAEAAAEKTAKQMGEEVVTQGGKKFIRKFGGKLIPLGVLGLTYLSTQQDVHAATQDPTKANLTRAGLSIIEATAETAAAGLTVAAVPTGGATLPAAGVAKGISFAAGSGNLGSYVVEHRDRIWDTVKDPGTYRKLYGNTRDFLVEKATDDKGISSLWHDEEKERQKAYSRLLH